MRLGHGGVEFEERAPGAVAAGPLTPKTGHYFWLVRTGVLTVGTDAGEFAVSAGALALVPAGRPRSLACGAGTAFWLLRLRRRAFAPETAGDAAAWALLGRLAQAAAVHPVLPLSPATAARLAEWWAEGTRRQAAGSPTFPAANKALAWLSLSALADDPRLAPLLGPSVDSARWERADALLERHLAEPWTTTAWARAAGLSRSALHRLCVAQTGLPPHRLLTRRRVARAATLLAGGVRTVADAAFAAGFGSVSRFYAACRRVHGQTPGALRRGPGA